MRLLIWNMQKRATAVEYLESVADTFDVALLQEVTDLRADAGRRASVIWRPRASRAQLDPPSARHGAAVVSPSLILDEQEPTDEYPWLKAVGGSVAVARDPEAGIWLASVHARASQLSATLLDALPHDAIPVTTRNGTLWETDVIPHELRRLFGDDPFVWGGDLNSA